MSFPWFILGFVPLTHPPDLPRVQEDCPETYSPPRDGFFERHCEPHAGHSESVRGARVWCWLFRSGGNPWRRLVGKKSKKLLPPKQIQNTQLATRTSEKKKTPFWESPPTRKNCVPFLDRWEPQNMQFRRIQASTKNALEMLRKRRKKKQRTRNSYPRTLWEEQAKYREICVFVLTEI